MMGDPVAVSTIVAYTTFAWFNVTAQLSMLHTRNVGHAILRRIVVFKSNMVVSAPSNKYPLKMVILVGLKVCLHELQDIKRTFSKCFGSQLLILIAYDFVVLTDTIFIVVITYYAYISLEWNLILISISLLFVVPILIKLWSVVSILGKIGEQVGRMIKYS